MRVSGGYQQAFAAEYYDFHPGLSQRPDVEFYVEFSRAMDGKTLELGCGTGRVLIPTAAAGCQVVGLDISEHMLARCRQKLKSQGKETQERVQLVQCTMTDFQLTETFDLVTIPLRSLQLLLHVPDQLACLQCANRHLGTGGKLVFDVSHVNPQRKYDTGDCGSEAEDSPQIPLPDGRKLRWSRRIASYHRAEQYNDMEFIYDVTYPDGQSERLVQAIPLRYFLLYEVVHLLARCGFRVVELFGDFGKSPLMDDSLEMICVSEKCRDAVGCS
jgi:SAM-dependent methyltransferase